MGYLHYWSLLLNDPAYQAAWPQLVNDTVRIVDAVRRAGIDLAGPLGDNRPILDATGDLTFNGDRVAGHAADTFTLRRPQNGGDRPQWIAGYCDTKRFPYDLAVAATLLRCHLLVPTALTLSSDGSWERQWKYGKKLPGRRRRAPAARTLLTDLFGPIPDTDPLTPLSARH
ncbi:hypothetical protein ACWT_3386 [Actinoplanes sp. SE50]|uniref:hypothetical protein n=1 Tax=unclassified Actinoplanes TaxID=2626549 RepID=UPI00023ED233|nr:MULTISPECIES: hypothetical protein [unclassified Actinoplanes]AEV84409.1 hypothetical protein ACPL_3514 [Actinoplanes sp. SE50/110]ATO82801.1 hypothetical protein ACWT_3386 [Actinoplanes sp. SE50]SLM00209.1 hypothetical protein ACSP50_3441 [Actinoplanes sp. SE50/110]